MALVIDSDTRYLKRNKRLPIQTGASFVKGQILIWTPTGLAGMPAAGTNFGAGGFTNANKIAGKAVSGSIDIRTGAAAKFADIEVAEPGVEFPFALYHTTPAMAVASLAAISGGGYELKSLLSGGINIPVIDLTQAGTANVAGRIVDYPVSIGGVAELPNWPGIPPYVTPCAQFALAFYEFRASVCAFTGVF